MLAHRGSTPDLLSGDWSNGDDSSATRLPGAKGAAALETLERRLAAAPEDFTRRIRANRDRRVMGASVSGAPALSTRAYLAQEVPFNGAVTGSHLMFGMAEVFDLMERGHWHMAEAHLGMLLVAGEQAAMDNWKWHHAGKLTMVPDPPFHSLIAVPGSSLSEPVSHLADPTWIATSMAFAKDLAVYREHSKASGTRPTPKAEADTREPRRPRRDTKGASKGQAAAEAAQY